MTFTRADVLAEWAAIRWDREGGGYLTWRRAAERIGMSFDAFERHLYREIAARRKEGGDWRELYPIGWMAPDPKLAPDREARLAAWERVRADEITRLQAARDLGMTLRQFGQWLNDEAKAARRNGEDDAYWYSEHGAEPPQRGELANLRTAPPRPRAWMDQGSTLRTL